MSELERWSVHQSTPAYRLNGTRSIPAAERVAQMQFYHMNHAASGSDGGFHSEILIAVDTHFCIAPEAWIRQAALVIGGAPMHFIMGVCPAEAWTLRKVDRDTWDSRATGRLSPVDGSPGPIEALFLSDGPAIQGWPEPARLDDLQSAEALAAKVGNRGIYKFHSMAFSYGDPSGSAA